MSEIEFLLMTLTPGTTCTVVYAGAAPGTHLRILATMFPTHNFILVDPAPFALGPEHPRILILQQMFTDELAKELQQCLQHSGTRVVFVSDIRSCDPLLHSEEIRDLRIREDMQSQARWHHILQPYKSMLKFRLPYTPGKTEYLKGDLYFPVWGPRSTTECRLVVGTNPGTQDYDNTTHEEKMFYFNTVTRVSLYHHGVCACGIDHCYDCKAEVEILGSYLRTVCMNYSDQAVSQLSEHISNSLSGKRTLAHKTPDHFQKMRNIHKHQWKGGMPLYEKFLVQK